MDKSEDTLRRLNYRYMRHGTPKVVEFEITDPSYFRVVFESMHDEGPQRFSIVPSEHKEIVAFELRFDTDEGTGEEGLISAVKFLSALLPSLSQKPWEGLGLLRSRQEKKKWLKLTGSK